MKVVQVKCPSCNSPIMSKQKDRFFHCDKCNVLHVRDGGTRTVDYEIAEFSDSAPRGERVYVPFWRLYCSFIIRSKSVDGDLMFKLTSWIKGSDDSGNLFVYVPAADFDPMVFKQMAMDFTLRSPKHRTRLNFGGVRRMPAVMSSEEASELADFVVVTMEAEKPGYLQRLDYSLTVNGSKVVYMPFVLTPSGLLPAL